MPGDSRFGGIGGMSEGILGGRIASIPASRVSETPVQLISKSYSIEELAQTVRRMLDARAA